MNDHLVVTRDLVKTFTQPGTWLRRGPAVRALDGVSLAITRGETLALVGESGSGKSTLGRILMRLLAPTAGSVTFDGTDILALDGERLRRFRRRMQIVFQDPYGSLNPRMRVGAAVAEPLEVHGIAKGKALDDRVATLFDEVGLDLSYRERFPHELSGGQRQRVGIARALAPNPEFLVLDEPVSALDVSVQAQVLNLLMDLRERHALTYLFIAHDLAVVRHLAARVAVIFRGHILEEGPVATLYAQPRHPYTRALLAAVPVPDPSRPRMRVSLAADLPGRRPTAEGCTFASRCTHPLKDAQCLSARPLLREFDRGHVAACHYAESSPEVAAVPTKE